MLEIEISKEKTHSSKIKTGDVVEDSFKKQYLVINGGRYMKDDIEKKLWDLDVLELKYKLGSDEDIETSLTLNKLNSSCVIKVYRNNKLILGE